MEGNCSVLVNSHWEMLLKVIVQPLGTVKRVLDSHLEVLLDCLLAILRGYWKAAGKCPNSRRQPIGDKTELPSGYWLKRGISIPFL
jgi:hypothetical protein